MATYRGQDESSFCRPRVYPFESASRQRRATGMTSTPDTEPVLKQTRALHRARVVSDDPEFHRAIAHCLAQIPDWTATPETSFALDGRNSSQAAKQAVVLDLRTDEALRRWQAFVQAGGPATEQIVPRIGVFEQGIPLKWAVFVDHTLSDAIVWPPNRDDLEKSLDYAVAHPRTLVEAGKHCALGSDVFQFATYTPSLFVQLNELRLAATHDFTILIVGETGTGKSTLARAIHEYSPRRKERFVTVACGALPGELINSELFGHVKGAFTGADRDKIGRLEMAGRGSILLDEVDVLDLPQQANLLRVIETGEYEPVGSSETRKLGARTIVASNVSLESLIETGRFRADLFFRLNQVRFEIPPLRERPLDIVPLTVEILESSAHEHPAPVRYIDPELVRLFKRYRWPGNIRELRNEVRRAGMLNQDGRLTPSKLTPRLVEMASQQPSAQRNGITPTGLAGELAQTEQQVIEKTLHFHQYNRAATARALGISRVTLYSKLRKYNISVNSLRRSHPR